MSTATATRDPAQSNNRKRNFGWLELCLFLSLVALIVQLLPGIVRIWQEWPTRGKQSPGHAILEAADGIHYETRYWLYLPRQYSNQQSWPLLLYLHGSGGCGEDLSRIRHDGPFHHLQDGHDLPLIVLAPQCPADQHWNMEQLLDLLEKTQTKFNVDSDRLYLAGFSMGAHGTWELAAAAPERFAAIVPVAGIGAVEHAPKLTQMPIWAFHGENDETVPPAGSTEIIQAIQAAGGNPKLTLFKNTGHGIDDDVFLRPEVYEWLLTQHENSK